tara:strand:- start:112 stop:372 length:261 start_codon:yes stop_codon:yes gene_type:complete
MTKDQSFTPQEPASNILRALEDADRVELEQAQLSDQDLARVEQYLSSPVHSIDRKPFSVGLMIGVLITTVVGLGLLSRFIAWLVLA